MELLSIVPQNSNASGLIMRCGVNRFVSLFLQGSFQKRTLTFCERLFVLVMVRGLGDEEHGAKGCAREQSLCVWLERDSLIRPNI